MGCKMPPDAGSSHLCQVSGRSEKVKARSSSPGVIYTASELCNVAPAAAPITASGCGLSCLVGGDHRLAQGDVGGGLGGGRPRLLALGDAGVEMDQLALERLLEGDRLHRPPGVRRARGPALQDQLGGRAAQEGRGEDQAGAAPGAEEGELLAVAG